MYVPTKCLYITVKDFLNAAKKKFKILFLSSLEQRFIMRPENVFFTLAIGLSQDTFISCKVFFLYAYAILSSTESVPDVH